LHLEAQAIVGEADVFWKLGVSLFVAQVVADVGEPGVFRLELSDERERLLDIRVHRMRRVTQRVENEVVESAQKRLRSFRDRAEIGEVCSVSKPESEDISWTVHRRDWNDLQIKKLERAINRVQGDAGKRADGLPTVEDIGEGLLQHFQCRVRSVDRNGSFLFQIVGADIVEAENMVGVGVSVENCVESIVVRGHCLGAEVGRRVDDDIAAGVGEQHGGAHAFVMRIF